MCFFFNMCSCHFLVFVRVLALSLQPAILLMCYGIQVADWFCGTEWFLLRFELSMFEFSSGV